MSNDTRIAVGVAKAVFELAISDGPGHVTRRERLPRGQFLAFLAQLPQATVVRITRIVWAVSHHQRPFTLMAKCRLSGHSRRIVPLTRELNDAKSVTVKQVGPAPGQPRTIVAFEAAVNDWLPGARIPLWPGVLGDSNNEAGDTFAVRTLSPARSRARRRSP